VTARPALDLSLYLVTDTAQCGEKGLATTVRDAVAAGVTVVQLRDSESSDAEFVELGRLLKSILRRSDVPLILNDRVHLVEAVGADGAHVGQGDLDVGEARALLGPAAYLGLSANTAEQVQAALRHGDALDYLGLGPVWPTGSKADAAPALGPERLAELVAASTWPCVAIGGITTERAAQVRAAGAAGVAVISAICGQPDVAQATAGLRTAWEGAAS
jgi:thiamine-phosphate pyrophosphorylase